MKDILLKTNERKKEILLSAGAGNILSSGSGEKDISGFTETANLNPILQQMVVHNNPEEKDVAQTIKQL